MKRIVLLICMMSVTSFAESLQEKAVGFLKWHFEKAASFSPAGRISHAESIFDIDQISADIRKEGRVRGLSTPIPKKVADNFIREMLAQPVTESTVKIVDIKVAEMASFTSIVMRFKAFPASSGLPEETKAQFRKMHSMNPRAGDSISRQYPSIPSYALRSANTLISYLEAKAAGNPPTHEYEFVFDKNSGLITDWKKLFREGQPRESQFLKFVDNIQKIKASGY